jgi:muramoyltetrapeptide carboxypeptidase
MAMKVRSLASVHGPVVTQLASLPEIDRNSWFALMEGRPKDMVGHAAAGTALALPGMLLPKGTPARLGPAPWLGGNLTMLACLCGTPYLPRFQNAILFLEDVGERPYRIDRFLTQLTLAGHLSHLTAIVLGDFTECDPDPPESPDVWSRLAACFEPLRVPVFRGYPGGHGNRNLAFLQGGRATITVLADGSGQLHFG